MMDELIKFLSSDELVRVYIVHNKDFPEKSNNIYRLAIFNPRSIKTIEIELPSKPLPGTIGARMIEAAQMAPRDRCKHDVHGTDCFECYPPPRVLDEAEIENAFVNTCKVHDPFEIWKSGVRWAMKRMGEK